MSAKNKVDKNKREGRTSSDQYDHYLTLMETDEIFRTGTVNPSVEDGYIAKKWENLVQKLNSCGTGPKLDTEGWKRRFTNWKNSTRAKYRRILEDKNGTGGGEASASGLTPHEDRGITVWGRVAITGTPKVQLTGGLQLVAVETEHQQEEQQADSGEIYLEKEIAAAEIVLENETEMEENEPLQVSKEGRTRPSTATTSSNGSRKYHRQPPYIRPFARPLPIRPSRAKPTMVAVGMNMLETFKSEKQKIAEVEKEKLNLEKIRLKFEIAKYKFENPSFVFDENF
ncbi:uncharacterized protein LOC135134609 [Zophobas morio]|uniref:uncharacterized protein LOC135134609 n=1 Tax=Zophobas morio TaxID=2755281 RepID=UPI00308358BB